MKEIVILGIHITNRTKDVVLIQDILTKFGCSIKTRIGLHDADEDNKNSDGIILLELLGDKEEMLKLENALRNIESLKVQKMIF